MNNDFRKMLNVRYKERLAFVAIAVLAGIFVAPLASIANLQQYALAQVQSDQTATGTTTTDASTNAVQTVEQVSTQSLSGNSNRNIGGMFYTLRWAPPTVIPANSPGVVFADCLPGEYPISPTWYLGAGRVAINGSFPALGNPSTPGTPLSWLAIVYNFGFEPQAIGFGVQCISAQDLSGASSNVILIPGVSSTIQNVVNKFVLNQQTFNIYNLQQVINLRQTLVQNAIQIAIVSGNNNTVQQSINQTASQILNANITSPTQAQQIANQNGNTTLAASPSTATTTTTTTNGNNNNANTTEQQNGPILNNSTTSSPNPRANATQTFGSASSNSVAPSSQSNQTTTTRQETSLNDNIDTGQTGLTGGGGTPTTGAGADNGRGTPGSGSTQSTDRSSGGGSNSNSSSSDAGD
jgi:hypothetical protein